MEASDGLMNQVASQVNGESVSVSMLIRSIH